MGPFSLCLPLRPPALPPLVWEMNLSSRSDSGPSTPHLKLSCSPDQTSFLPKICVSGTPRAYSLNSLPPDGALSPSTSRGLHEQYSLLPTLSVYLSPALGTPAWALTQRFRFALEFSYRGWGVYHALSSFSTALTFAFHRKGP